MISIKQFLERPEVEAEAKVENRDELSKACGKKGPVDSRLAPAFERESGIQPKPANQLEPADQVETASQPEPATGAVLGAAMSAYRSALMDMGNCSRDACPVVGEELKQGLSKLAQKLCAKLSLELVERTESDVREQLQGWSRRTATHYQQKTNEVKDLLLVMANAAESVGERDQRCAQQITEVTTRLRGIANLEDLTEIRESIKKSATELKTSIDRMSAEGKAAINHLQAQVTRYQVRLEEAEEMASRDSLTGLRSRASVEGQIERSFHVGAPFCVAILDINEFKHINDEHGHLVGDEVLKLFSTKMQSVCRSTDLVGRWGGDEFILLLHCGLKEAQTQIDRLQEWVDGSYTVQGSSGPLKLHVDASAGLAERLAGEKIKDLLDRADAEMYRDKAARRAKKENSLG